MTLRVTIGIDPGASGAIAVLHDGEPAAVFDMPTFTRKAGGEAVNDHDLIATLRHYCMQPGAHHFGVLEAVGAGAGFAGRKPGGQSMFRFGEAFGVARCALAAAHIGYTLVAPVRWKKHFGLIGTDKDVSRTLCIQRFPGIAAELTRKKDNGRADAILIARWAWETEQYA